MTLAHKYCCDFTSSLTNRLLSFVGNLKLKKKTVNLKGEPNENLSLGMFVGNHDPKRIGI